MCFREQKQKATKHPEYLAQINKELRDGSKFQMISTKNGSTGDQCCFHLHILHKPIIGFGLLLEMETLFRTRDAATRASRSAHYRKYFPLCR